MDPLTAIILACPSVDEKVVVERYRTSCFAALADWDLRMIFFYMGSEEQELSLPHDLTVLVAANWSLEGRERVLKNFKRFKRPCCMDRHFSPALQEPLGRAVDEDSDTVHRWCTITVYLCSVQCTGGT